MTFPRTDEEWAKWHEQRARDRERILRPIREGAGYPTDPGDPYSWHLRPEDTSETDVMWRYIEALESEVVARDMARRIIRGF